MQYRTLMRAAVPRLRCAEHGVQQVRVPWAKALSRFTALFEAMVIDWLKVASVAAVAAVELGPGAGIQERAVRRALSRYLAAAARPADAEPPVSCCCALGTILRSTPRHTL